MLSFQFVKLAIAIQFITLEILFVCVCVNGLLNNSFFRALFALCSLFYYFMHISWDFVWMKQSWNGLQIMLITNFMMFFFLILLFSRCVVILLMLMSHVLLTKNKFLCFVFGRYVNFTAIRIYFGLKITYQDFRIE